MFEPILPDHSASQGRPSELEMASDEDHDITEDSTSTFSATATSLHPGWEIDATLRELREQHYTKGEDGKCVHVPCV